MMRCTIAYPSIYTVNPNHISDNNKINHNEEGVPNSKKPSLNIQIAKVPHTIVCDLPPDGSAYEQLLQYVKEDMKISHPSIHFVDDEGDECRVSTEAQLLDAYTIWGDELRLEVNLDDAFVLKSDIPSPTITAMDSPSFSASHSLSASKASSLPSIEDPLLFDHDSDDELYHEARTLSTEIVNTNSDRKTLESTQMEAKTDNDTFCENPVNPVNDELSKTITQAGFPHPLYSVNNTESQTPPCVNVDGNLEDPGNELAITNNEEVILDPLIDNDYNHEMKQDVEPSLDTENDASSASSSNFDSIALSDYFAAFFNLPEIRQAIDQHKELVQESLVSDDQFFHFLEQLNQLCPAASAHPFTQLVYSLRKIHVGTTCIHCFQSPIQGIRYHCNECTNLVNPIDSLAENDPVDICVSCYLSGAHVNSHTLIRLDNPQFELLPQKENCESSLKSASVTKEGKFSAKIAAAGRKILAEMKEFRMKLNSKVDPIIQDIVNDMKRAMSDISKSVDSLFSPKRNRENQSQSSKDEEKSTEMTVVDSVNSQNVPDDESSSSLNDVSIQPSSFPITNTECVEVNQPVLDEDENFNLQPPSYPYGNEVEIIRAMGFICAAADEQTVIELLNASKGNVDQTIQWMTDCIGYGK